MLSCQNLDKKKSASTLTVSSQNNNANVALLSQKSHTFVTFVPQLPNLHTVERKPFLRDLKNNKFPCVEFSEF